jgi:hypothetical protein
MSDRMPRGAPADLMRAYHKRTDHGTPEHHDRAALTWSSPYDDGACELCGCFGCGCSRTALHAGTASDVIFRSIGRNPLREAGDRAAARA